MIAVIADDLSGAAELAGTAHAFGYRAEIQTELTPSSDAEIIAFDTDTRSLSAAAAAARAGAAAKSLAAMAPALLYKKTDSVLRGHVLAEVHAILAVTGMARALLAPANPSRDRVIRGGRYFIGETPLDETVFRDDPEYPCRTADVRELLGASENDDAIATPDVPDAAAVTALASRIDTGILPAGGNDFFEALLKRIPRRETSFPDPDRELASANRLRRPPTANGKTLFLCGSPTGWKCGREEECASRGIPVAPMPAGLFHESAPGDLVLDWADDVTALFKDHEVAMATVGRLSARATASTQELVRRMADMIESVLAQRAVARLCAEGGATASAVVRRLGWTRLPVSRQLAPGVVAVQTPDEVELILKPGSYPWPSEVWGTDEGSRSRR